MKYQDGLTRDPYGKRTDKTGERDLLFSQWHRRYLSNRCYTTDIDFFEYRIINGEIVPKAFLEVKQSHVRQRKYIVTTNNKAILKMAQQLGIKFLIVLYEPTIKEQKMEELRKCNEQIEQVPPECTFYVWEVKDIFEFEKYDESRFSEFFKKYSQEDFIIFMENL